MINSTTKVALQVKCSICYIFLISQILEKMYHVKIKINIFYVIVDLFSKKDIRTIFLRIQSHRLSSLSLIVTRGNCLLYFFYCSLKHCSNMCIYWHSYYLKLTSKKLPVFFLTINENNNKLINVLNCDFHNFLCPDGHVDTNRTDMNCKRKSNLLLFLSHI